MDSFELLSAGRAGLDTDEGVAEPRCLDAVEHGAEPFRPLGCPIPATWSMQRGCVSTRTATREDYGDR